MNRVTYLHLTEEYERLCNILNELSYMGKELEHDWKTDAGKLFSASFTDTQMYIRKILDQFRSECSLISVDGDNISDGLDNFKF